MRYRGGILPFIEDACPGSTPLKGQAASVTLNRISSNKNDFVCNAHIEATPLAELDKRGWNTAVVKTPLNNAAVKKILPDTALRYSAESDSSGEMLQALHIHRDSDVLVVPFHGPLNRQQMQLPRFEWLSTLSELDVSTLFFVDPTLELDNDLQLAWYTGRGDVSLHRTIADWIQNFAETYNYRRIILTGSSGGGFAALQTGAYVPGCTVLAFNAQTDIPTYLINNESYGAQREYLRVLWPDIFTLVEPLYGKPDFANWGLLLDSRISAQRTYSIPRNNRVHIVQNLEEFHYETQFKPFIKTALEAGNAVTFSTNREGKIHNPPRKQTFLAELKRVLGRPE